MIKNKRNETKRKEKKRQKKKELICTTDFVLWWNQSKELQTIARGGKRLITNIGVSGFRYKIGLCLSHGMSWCRTGDKPSPQALMTNYGNAYIDDLVQDCSISIAHAKEILQSCTKPLICIIRHRLWVHLIHIGRYSWCVRTGWPVCISYGLYASKAYQVPAFRRMTVTVLTPLALNVHSETWPCVLIFYHFIKLRWCV